MSDTGQVVARCEVCALVYELEDLRLVAEVEPVADCKDCAGPLYLVDRDDVINDSPEAEAARAAYVDGWIEGWNASANAVRQFVRAHGADVDRTSEVVIAAVEAAR